MKVILALCSILVILVIAINIDDYNQTFLLKKGIYNLSSDILYKIFGEFRDYLSIVSFLNADMYFHGGVSHTLEEGETLHLLEEKDIRQDQHVNGKMEHHDHDHHHGEEIKAVTNNVLLNINNAIALTEHKHLLGNEEKELLPWLYYSVKLNPHNILAYVIAGYWVGIRMKQPEEAVSFLKKGLTDNPRSWELYKTIGEIYFIGEKDYKKAQGYFERAKDIGDSENIDNMDKRGIYVFLAESYARLGELKKSLAIYDKLLIYFPDDPRILEKRKYFESLINIP